MTEQQALAIPLTDAEKVRLLYDTLQKRGQHSLYCGWDHDRGAYRREWGCTCGLSEALEKGKPDAD